MKNVTMKEIKENGSTFGQFLGFDIFGRIEAEEIVLTASVLLEEDSDASVFVAEVSCEKMTEAKDLLKEELRSIEHNADDIKALASEHKFSGAYEDLLELVNNTESYEASVNEQTVTEDVIDAQNVVEELSTSNSQSFAEQCAAASLAAEQDLDAAIIDAETNTTHQEQPTEETLPEPIQNAVNEIEALSSIEARSNAYKSFYIETHKQLIEATTTKRRARVSNLAVVSHEIKSTASAQRGEEARQQIEKDAMKYLGMTNVTFDRRGKYKDWYISATDEHGQEMCQRLDAFKKSLQKVIDNTN